MTKIMAVTMIPVLALGILLAGQNQGPSQDAKSVAIDATETAKITTEKMSIRDQQRRREAVQRVSRQQYRELVQERRAKAKARAEAQALREAKAAQRAEAEAATQAPAQTSVVARTSVSGNRKIGQDMMLARGWDISQWSCLDSLWTRESGWTTTAANPSGAYGIPQALPGSKMAVAGSDWQTNPATQISWGLSYIGGRYGSPCNAWYHSETYGWY